MKLLQEKKKKGRKVIKMDRTRKILSVHEKEWLPTELYKKIQKPNSKTIHNTTNETKNKPETSRRIKR